jgi:hypothetical protein
LSFILRNGSDITPQLIKENLRVHLFTRLERLYLNFLGELVAHVQGNLGKVANVVELERDFHRTG